MLCPPTGHGDFLLLSMPAWVKHPAFFLATVMTYYPLITLHSWLTKWETPFCLSAWGWAGLLAILIAVAGMAWAHKKGLAALPGTRTLWPVLLLAILYDVSGNLYAFVSPWQLPLSILLTISCLCLLWALMRRWALLLWLPFLILSLFQILGHLEYGSSINSLVVAETLEASQEEVFTYLTWGNILALSALLLLAVGYGLLQIPVMRGAGRRALLHLGLLTGGASLFFGALMPPHHQSATYYWPPTSAYALANAFIEAVSFNQATINQVENLPSPAEQPSALPTLKGNEGVVLVVHVGESIRADRMSLNGYERDTTPWLRRQTNLINFPTCISSMHDTCMAEIVIMTNGRRYVYDKTPGMQPTTGSVLELFQANGFDIYSFFGQRCAQQLKYDRVVRMLTRCSKQRFNAPGYPWTSVPQMKEVLRQNPRRNLVLFINNEGSHTPFNYFDEASAPFLPAKADFQHPAAHAEEINNAYDNTIHYTDEFFRRVAEELKGRPFVYLYISDHGEYLGHDGLWGRAALGEKHISYFATDGCRVGAFVLYSPEFRALNPHFDRALEQLEANSGMLIAHEHFFHTLLGLFGLQTPHYAETLDLCSPHPAPYDGPSPEER